jgi:DNA polymerase elongation subunit (family B)
VGYQWYGEKKVYCPSILDYPNDMKADLVTSDWQLLRDFVEVHNSADAVVTWYGKGFDYKWLQAKCFEYKLPYLAPIPHIDLCFTAKAHFKAGGNSLKNISELGGFKQSKTPVDSDNWRRAAVGEEWAIRNVISHCKSDVQMTSEAYTRMKPLIRNGPRMGPVGTCSNCGSDALTFRGRALTKYKGEFTRFSCKDCGSWGQKPRG